MNSETRHEVATALRAAAAKLTAGAMSLLDKLFLAALLNKETVALVAEEARHLAVKSKGAATAATLRKQLATDKSLLDALTHRAVAAAPTLRKVLDKYLEQFDHRGSGLAIGSNTVFIEVENQALNIRFEAVSNERVWDDPGINGEPLGDDEFTFLDNMGADVSDFLSKVLKPARVAVSPEVYSENGDNDFFAYSVGLTHSLPKDFVEQVLRGLEQRFPAELTKALDDSIADASD